MWRSSDEGGESIGGITNIDSCYLLELSRWNVKNNAAVYDVKIDAVNNSNGINSALVWAVQQGYSEVALPKGTYLIDEQVPIKIPSYMTFNLNGSKLRIRDNDLESYTILLLDTVKYARVTNGILEGDKDTHKYIADGVGSDTHEGGLGIHVIASKFIAVDNLEIFNMTGDGGGTNNKGGTIAFYLRLTTCESGSYDLSTGLPKVDANRIRWSNKLNVADPNIVNVGYFTLAGSGYGALGSEIIATHYDVAFYNSDDSFNSSVSKVEFFSRVDVPKNAKWAKFSLYQNKLPMDSGNNLMVWNLQYAEKIFFERNNIHHCRRQGLSLGGQFIYVRDNEIHHIKGTLPQGGIDVEDGYDLNQHYFFERNHFHDNAGYDLVVTNGKVIRITDNRFQQVQVHVSLAINEPADRVVIRGNYFHQAFVVIAGEQIVSDNQFFGCNIQFSGGLGNGPRQMLIHHNMFHNCMVTIKVEKPFLLNMDGCRFLNDRDKSLVYGMPNTLILMGEPQVIKGCTFDGPDTSNFISGSIPKGGWIFDNCVFVNLGNANDYKFPPGTYKGCQFTNINFTWSFQGITGEEYNLYDCKITVDPSFNMNLPTMRIGNGLKAARIINCLIDYVGGIGIKVDNASDEFIFTGNRLNCTGTDKKTMISIESTFTGNRIIIDNNELISSNPRKSIENMSSSMNIFVRNNMILGAASFDLRDKEVKAGNYVSGILDPYYQGNTVPTSGFFALGQIVKNSLPKSGSPLGWVVTEGGYADIGVWGASKLYSAGNRLTASGHVYEAQNNGISSKLEPAWTTTSGSLINDTVGVTVWTAGRRYSIGDQILPTVSNGSFYECIAITTGISGSVEPKWTTSINTSFLDVGVTWRCVRPYMVWREMGGRAVFRTYGVISIL